MARDLGEIQGSVPTHAGTFLSVVVRCGSLGWRRSIQLTLNGIPADVVYGVLLRSKHCSAAFTFRTGKVDIAVFGHGCSSCRGGRTSRGNHGQPRAVPGRFGCGQCVCLCMQPQRRSLRSVAHVPELLCGCGAPGFHFPGRHEIPPSCAVREGVSRFCCLRNRRSDLFTCRSFRCSRVPRLGGHAEDQQKSTQFHTALRSVSQECPASAELLVSGYVL